MRTKITRLVQNNYEIHCSVLHPALLYNIIAITLNKVDSLSETCNEKNIYKQLEVFINI